MDGSLDDAGAKGCARSKRLGGHLKEEVLGEEKENEVGGPGGEKRGELADAAHGFGEGGQGPVGDADADTEGEATDCTAAADEQGKRNREHHADGSDERIGEFFVPLHGESGNIKAGVVKAGNVVPQAAPAELKGLEDFAIEVGGWLGEFGEGGDLERGVALDFGLGEITDPAGFEDPSFLGVEPAGARGKDAALHLEGGGIEFDDGKPAKEILSGIEQVIVIDFVVFAKDPALRARVSLCRLALDDVAVGVLALVGVREVGVVEDEEGGGDGETGEEEGEREAVERDAAGLEGNDFVVLAENAEGNEDGDKGAERSELIDGVGNQIAEITGDDGKGDVVAADVFGEFEEGEDFEEEEKGDHDDREEVEEAAEDVEVDDGGKAGVGGGGEFTVCGTGGASLGAGFAAAAKAPEGGDAGEGGGDGGFPAIAFEAREEGDTDEGDKNVGGPDADAGGDDALAGEAGTGDEDEVIGGDDDDSEKGAGGASTAAGLSAERDGDEGENEAGDGKSEALIEFDASVAPARAVVVAKLRDGTLGIGDGAFLDGGEVGDLNGPVGTAKGSNGVMVWSIA